MTDKVSPTAKAKAQPLNVLMAFIFCAAEILKTQMLQDTADMGAHQYALSDKGLGFIAASRDIAAASGKVAALVGAGHNDRAKVRGALAKAAVAWGEADLTLKVTLSKQDVVDLIDLTATAVRSVAETVPTNAPYRPAIEELLASMANLSASTVKLRAQLAAGPAKGPNK